MIFNLLISKSKNNPTFYILYIYTYTLVSYQAIKQKTKWNVEVVEWPLIIRHKVDHPVKLP